MGCVAVIKGFVLNTLHNNLQIGRRLSSDGLSVVRSLGQKGNNSTEAVGRMSVQFAVMNSANQILRKG